MQGDRVSGARKPATSRPGWSVQVPLFVNTGRRDQGRHPHRRVPDPGLSAGGRLGSAPADAPARARPASGRCRCSTRPSRRRLARRRCWPSCRCRPTRSPSTWSTGSRPTSDRGRRADRRRPRSGWPLDRMPVVDRLVLRLAVPSCSTPTGPRWRWSSTRRSSWPSRTRPRSRAASSTACCPPSPPRCARRSWVRHSRAGASASPRGGPCSLDPDREAGPVRPVRTGGAGGRTRAQPYPPAGWRLRSPRPGPLGRRRRPAGR